MHCTYRRQCATGRIGTTNLIAQVFIYLIFLKRMQGQINMHSNRRRQQRELITRHMPRSIFTGASNIFYTHTHTAHDRSPTTFLFVVVVASSRRRHYVKLIKNLLYKKFVRFIHTHATTILYLVENDMPRIKMKMYPL